MPHQVLRKHDVQSRCAIMKLFPSNLGFMVGLFGSFSTGFFLMASDTSPSSPDPAPASEYDPFQDPQLAEGTLALKWDDKASLRRRVSQGSPLTQWPQGPKGQSTAGIPSVAAMSLNPLALECLAEWWCPTQSAPKAIPVDILRREVWMFQFKKYSRVNKKSVYYQVSQT